MSHLSSAVQWAVVMKKPIIFITTDEIENKSYGKPYSNMIFNFAKILGKKVGRKR